MTGKVLSLEQLTEARACARAEGRKVVATNGCFDLLHVGHVRYLEDAAKLGDILVVGVNGDASVRQLKGNDRPLNRAEDRAEILAALEVVDWVTIFPEKRATRFLEAAEPDYYAKGGDYSTETLDPSEKEILEQMGSELKIIPFRAGYSTSNLISRMSHHSNG